MLRHEADLVIAYVHGLLDDGIPLEALLLDLFAPAARRLGTMWEADEIDFVDVTIGTSRLQQILHHLHPAAGKQMPVSPAGGCCFVPAPSEQHTFGLLMVSRIFPP